MDRTAAEKLMERTATDRSGATPDRTAGSVSLSRGHLAEIIRNRRPSPHRIDLKPTETPAMKAAAAKAAAPKKVQRRLPAKWQMLLDERIHLKDMNARSVSVRPRGWRDLPAPEATTFGEAVVIALRKFFQESPFADLTVLMLVHTVAVLTWKLAFLPLHKGLEATGLAKPRPALAEPEGPRLLPLGVAVPRMAPQADVVPRLGQLLFGSVNPQRLRQAFAVAGIALLFAVPLGTFGYVRSLQDTRQAVTQRGMQALTYLKDAAAAARSSDFFGAGSAFAMADEEFGYLREELGSLSSVLSAASAVMPSSSVSSAGLMLVAGEEAAAAGRYLTEGLSSLESEASPAEKMRAVNAALDRALPHLDRATEAVMRMSPAALPEEYRGFLDTAKAELPQLNSALHEAAQMASFLAAMLGSDEPKRYLVVFQNNSELRPTGGFIGSFALMDVDGGEVTNLEIPGGGSYDLQGSLTEHIVSPRPLRLINTRWEFQDANWSPDFPTSAARLAWFYEKSGGPTVDGVIAVNASVMTRLLELTGPVDMPDYDVTVDADNFVAVTQQLVEFEYDREENRPKQVIADLAPIMIERLTSDERPDWLSLASAAEDSLAVKDVQMWFRSEEMQSRADGFGWTGAMTETRGDYLQVVHTNIAGQKTDSVMEESVGHATKILADGSAIVTLTIARTHNGIKGEPLTGVRNVDYLRVYVPLGSTLVEAEGFEIPDAKLFQIPEAGYETDPTIAEQEAGERLDRRSGTRTWTEGGKTVFGNWVQTDPGETGTVTIVYQLPPNTVEMREPDGGPLSEMFGQLTNTSTGTRMAYGLQIQKQSGSAPVEFTSSVNLPRGYYVTWEDPDRETDERGRETFSLTLDRDMFTGLVAESPK